MSHREGVIANGDFDWSPYAPPPVLWVTSLLDLVLPFDWRATFLSNATQQASDSWIMQRIPSLSKSLPKLLEYDEFARQQQHGHADITASSSSWSSQFDSIYKFCFQTPSTSLGDVTSPTSCLVLILLVLLLRATKLVLMPLFRRLGTRAAKQTHGVEWTHNNPIRIAKFGEYVFRLLYHSMISVYGVVAFSKEDWWVFWGSRSGRSLFQGYPYHVIEPSMAWYYLLQSAYNVDALLTLLEISFEIVRTKPHADDSRRWFPWTIQWSSTVRGDFQEMCIHHVVTNVLVIGSSYFRLTRPGSMVFLVHDLSDVPVDLSKLANFVKYKKTTIACFILMVLVWIATRLYVLPFVFFWAALTESHYLMDYGLPPLIYIGYRHLFYSLVAFLILLHITWFGMFMRIFYTMVHKNEVHDYSEHKSGELQDPQKYYNKGNKKEQ